VINLWRDISPGKGLGRTRRGQTVILDAIRRYDDAYMTAGCLAGLIAR
jgi:hypothetical protein